MKQIFCLVIAFMSQISAAGFSYHIATGLYPRDVLSGSDILCIDKDSHGFMWFGTNNGLYRYDGAGFHLFREGESVRAICMLGNRMYIGSDNGLFVYDEEKDNFMGIKAKTAYHVSIARPITALALHGNNLLIGTSGQGLFVLDTVTGSMVQRSVNIPFITDIAVSDDGQVYVCVKGVGIYSSGANFEYKSPLVSGKDVERILAVENNLWYLTESSVVRIDPNNHGKEIRLQKRPADIVDFSEKQVLISCEDGFFLLDKYSLEKELYGVWVSHEDRVIRTCGRMFRDDTGTLWLTDPSIGVVSLTAGNERSRYYPLGACDRMSFCETSDRTVWIGTSEGLMRLNTADKTLEKGSLVGKAISSILSDGDNVWALVAGDGVYRYDVRTDILKKYANVAFGRTLFLNADNRVEVKSDWHNYVYSPYADNFIIRKEDAPGTAVYGDNLSAVHSVTSMCTNSEGTTFTAVGDCVYESSFLSKDSRYYPLNSNVEVVFCDNQDNVWAGTFSNGLWKLTSGEKEHIEIAGVSGSANKIFSIVQDNGGYLWICSNAGIAKMDPKEKTSSEISLPGRAFTKGDFLPRAAICSQDGTLYFGCEKGVLSFPSTEKTDKRRPKVLICSADFRNDTPPVPNLYTKEQLKLKYNCNSFTLSFAMPGSYDARLNQYRFSLSGIDENDARWGRESVATYSNLPPGKYVFKLNGRNLSGVEADNTARLKIIISPPWWRSLWAYFLYGIAALAGMAWLYRRGKRHIDDKYSAELHRQQEAMEKEAYRQKMSFFMGMVHEIRTPMTIMRLSMDKLSNAKNGADSSSLSILQENLDYMQSTIDGILNYQKNNLDGVQLSFSEVNLVDLCHSAVEKLSGLAQLKRISFREDVQDAVVPILADGPFFSKMIVNLLDNALKYARREVVISIRTEDDEAVVKVSDDGPGVKEQEKERIFDIFYKAEGDSIAESSGIGVGLAYSKQLVLAHKGTLSVEDTVPTGATFVVRIPLLGEKTLVEQPAVDDVLRALEKSGATKFRLVLADDNVRLLDMLQKELSEWYHVRTAQNGAEALEILRTDDVDIIVSDVMMPIMDGIQFCQTVKDTLELNHIPFIMLTAKTSVAAKVEGLGSGADAYVEKPFSITQLHLQIENLLRLRTAYHEALLREAGRYKEAMPKSLNKMDAREDDEDYQNPVDRMFEELEKEKPGTFAGRQVSSPNDYLKNYRLNRAAQLIADGSRINEAAESVGFFSPSYFAKCFKAKFGILPKAYSYRQQE